MRLPKKVRNGFLVIAIQFSCIACTPVWLKYDQAAKELQLNRVVMTTADFNIVVYQNPSLDSNHKRLHVYLDGDGSPWGRSGSMINDDPTPRQHLVLQLMSLDPSPSVLIGRPCYHGFNRDPSCHPLLWTHARYSEKVVSAISTVLESILMENNASEAVLIGYSGGGTLAQLLAERILKTRAVITLAGNLDLTAWARLHGYSLLEGSLNPAEMSALPGHILQIHYIGRFDTNIPLSLAESCLASNKKCAEIRILEGVDHYNGWLEQWPNILININKQLGI
ncbi:alpha/beta hydrolase [Candidatus Contendibacter odensensis]|uniref:Alpha/beta hydrolase n=1 Tax=Candidatus Contendobacter odensis Run_B_J11 TaxID=1400861 RepID=A0A7U7GBI1_9GAMM|nr:alpha/beta hydrolase [Candidatus Contendobacter odensis]CDH45112.1 conserved hypothetical protein [Candidatus Contendobacter odensis Run_B_J11]